MRKLIIAVGIIVAIIIVVLLVAPAFLNVNRYHDRIQAELQKKLNRSVSLGQMHLKLLPPTFRVENVVIGEDPNLHSTRPFAQAQDLYVSVAFWPLIHGDVQVNSLELQKPHIELIRNPQGIWNFSSLGHNATAPTTAPAAPNGPVKTEQQRAQQAQEEQAKQNPEQFSLANLKITDGQVAITDLQKHQSRAVYDHIDLAVKGFEPGKAFDIDLAAHLPGSGAQLVNVSGTAGPIPSGDMTKTPFKGSYKLDQVALSGVQKFLNSPALNEVSGTATGNGDISNRDGVVSASGTLRLDNGRYKGNDIGYPISANYSVTDDLNNDLLKIEKGDLKLGSTPVNVAGTLNAKPTPAQLDMTIKTGNVSISEIARLASVFGVAFNPKMKIDGQVQADLRAQGAANQPALNGTLNANDLTMSGDGIAKPVQVKAVDLQLTPQQIRSNQFDATTGNTTVAMQFALSQYTSASPAIDATVRTNGANLGDVLDIAKAYGVSAADGMSGSGSLTLDVHAAGPLKGSAPMNFSGTGKLQNASINTPQLTKPVLVHNADLRFTSDSAVLQNLSASVGQTNATGTMTMRNFNAPQVQFTLNADKVSVAELQGMMKPTPAAPQKAAFDWRLVPSADAQTAAQPGILQKTTGTGVLTAGSVLYDQLVLNNVHSNVNLDRGVIRLAPVTAELYGGQQTGEIVIDTRPAVTTYAVDSKLANVDANKLLSSVSSLKQTLYGLLSANANTHFVTSTNATSADIARSLNGTLGVNLVKGRIMNMDILQQLASIGKFAGFTHQAQNFTNIAKLAGNFNVVNGVATTNNLQAAIDGGTLAATGSANMVDQSLNMHMTAVLSKAMSQQVGGTGIGGFMNTALANQNGELVLPILVTGTFSAPRFAPDLQAIAQMKLQNMVPTLGNPGQMTSGILGAILGKKGQQGGQQGQQGGVGGILGGILGGQQQQQQQPNRGKQPVGSPQQPQQQPQSPQSQKQQPQDIFGQILGAVSGQQQNQQQQQQQNQNPPKR